MFYNNVIIVTISIGCFGMILVEYFQQQKGSEGSILQQFVGFNTKDGRICLRHLTCLIVSFLSLLCEYFISLPPPPLASCTYTKHAVYFNQ